MTRTWVIRVTRDILRVIGGAAGVVFFFTPFHTSEQVLLQIAALIIGIICFGAAQVLNLELEIPKPPPGSKHDPSRPLGL